MTTAERTTAIEERLEVVTWYDTKKFRPDMETYHNFNNIYFFGHATWLVRF